MEAEHNKPELMLSSKKMENRPSWKNKTEYLLAQVGFSVGLGTIWRFPYLCHSHGGGTFLVPYVFLLFIVGMPLVFMEMALGQNLRLGSIGVWRKIHPRMWGVGLASCLICFMVALYYNIVIAWSIFYLSHSFQYPLPWSQCPKNIQVNFSNSQCKHITPSIYFWYYETLDITRNIEYSGGIVGSIVICLFVVWFFNSLVFIQGIKTTGKVLQFSVMVPYVILLCFLVRSYLLDGSSYGLRRLVSIHISNISSLMLWRQASTQMFFSMGLGSGGIITMASYVAKSNNCAQDAFVVVFCNLASCLLATQVVFAVLGFRAASSTRECIRQNSWKLRQLIEMGTLPLEANPPSNLNRMHVKAYTLWLQHLDSNLRKQILEHVSECNLENEFQHYMDGPGLVFVAFAEAITKFPGSSFWSVIFFLMFSNLGFSTSLGLMNSILTPILDTFPYLRKFPFITTVVISFMGFLGSLLFTQRSGLYFLSMFDDFAVTLPLVIVAFFENISVAWIYGSKRFMKEVWDLLGIQLPLFHHYVLRYITQLVLAILLINSLLELILNKATYGAWNKITAIETYEIYPVWGMVMGFMIIFLIILPIPVGLFTYNSVIMPLSSKDLPSQLP